jgi:NAD(P)-dependent dehydrogenase (short-subunit alcohol dehydrogenase family)
MLSPDHDPGAGMILIAGASRGLGAALLSHYRAAGEEVVGTARHPTGDLVPLDVTDPASVTALGARFAARRLDLLICNAGIYPDRQMVLETGFDAATWAATFATNVTGPFLVIQALLPALRAAAGAKAAPAKIAVISSQMGSNTRATGGAYAYRASKSAVLNIGRNLATDLRRDGIAVGIYHPGWVMTDMTAGSAANVPPPVAASGLAARFAALSLDTSGCFETYEGVAMPL